MGDFMNNEQLNSYNQKRNEIIKKYNKIKLKNSLTVVIIGVLLLGLCALIGVLLKNVAIALVLGAVVFMFFCILLRIKIVSANHTMQTQLKYFEQDFEIYK